MTTAPDRFDVVVIGAGPAGTSAALRAAELGARVAVVEAARTGGTCVNTGCVPTRVFAKTARLAREVRIAHRYGLAVSDPVIDWAETVARVRATVDRVRDLKDEPDRFARAGITLILEGRARFVDANTLELDSGRRLSGDSIIVAVGGHSRPLPIPGAELAVVPEHVLDLPELPARLAIIGAGNTGAQLVTVFSAFGSRVTLLDVAPRVLAAADEQISDAVGAAFAEQGVEVRTGIETVEGLTAADDGSVVLGWREVGESRSTTVDAVIMATGWPADVEGLGLEAAGVQTVRSAIPVDQ
ncbi:MAG TPA: NAD(P)/FAD-dependent oxidoreductase, partial [Solirubrobacteraceae bacterium]|nr:NAD(P)/FAD-dependent oxidoreductase [Solirubrobacteraceae bacterium]